MVMFKAVLAILVGFCLILATSTAPKRTPIADIEHWRCQVNEKHWFKFRVVEGEMRVAKQPWPEEMLGETKI